MQAGAFTRAEDAEQQRAQAGDAGLDAPRSASASRPAAPIYRVRAGPVSDARRGRRRAGTAAGSEHRSRAGARRATMSLAASPASRRESHRRPTKGSP
ncbi:MAG: SPOR domain-containing protein [Comamonadaceae bacterium]|nr:SPOR domain-containing protein [Comamonadaceae bacterium]